MEELNAKSLKRAVDYIDSWLEINFANERIPGLQVAIQHKDKLIYSRAFGYANLETKEKLTNKHIFRIASHSKTFTATSIMQLVEAGKLNLDDSVSQYLIWFKSTKDKRVEQVTVRQILNQTSGLIRDGLDCNYWQDLHPFPNVDDLKRYISEAELIYDPDVRFKYSNFAFSYLGLVIESISNLSYKKYVTRNIIEELDLKLTGPDLDEKSKENLVVGYSNDQFSQSRRSFNQINTHALAPATGFYSTAEDLCKYFSAHFLNNNKLLNNKTKRQMQHGYWEADEEDNYGLGLVNTKKDNWDLYGHSGGFPGFITNTLFDARKGLVVSVLTNSQDGPALNISNKLINIIDSFRENDTSKAINKLSTSKLQGRFFPIWGVIDIVAIGSKTLVINPLGWSDFSKPDELVYVNKNTLKVEKANGYSSPGELVEFAFDKSNKIKNVSYAGLTMWPYEIAKGKCWLEGYNK